MDTATDASLTKRVRFDDNGQNPVATPRRTNPTAPLGIAESTVRTHLESLHPNLASILLQPSLDYIKNQAQAFHKMKQITRMTDEVDVIPRSARVAFQFNVSAAAEKSLTLAHGRHFKQQ